MCCGDICDCGYNIASILYVSERLASCCAAMAVVVCLVATLIIMLAMGIGLGYNYCVVDHKMEVTNPLPSKSERDHPMPPNDGRMYYKENPYHVMGTEDITSVEDRADQSLHRWQRGRKRSIDTNIKIPTNNRLSSLQILTIKPLTTLSSEHLEIKPTMMVPLWKYNLSSFIERLRKYNKNVTLELIQ